MKVKIDTKEKFHAITVTGTSLSATMTAELSDLLLPYLQNDVKNVILNLKELQILDEIAAEKLVKLQQKFYENNSSFVICGMQKPVEEFLDNVNLLEMMNITPTESEAWILCKWKRLKEKCSAPCPPPRAERPRSKKLYLFGIAIRLK